MPRAPSGRKTRPSRPLIAGERVLLRRVRKSDEREWVALRRSNRSFLERWEPKPSDGIDRFSAKGFSVLLRRSKSPARLITLVCLRSTGEIVGMVTLNEIVRGAFQSATMGYWIARRHARRGLMTEAVRLMLAHAFGALGLHRVEANMIPRNKPSGSLARAVGMRYEGTARRYLQINGRWEDHERWAITAKSRPARRTRRQRRPLSPVNAIGIAR